jgi:hypothetical protein
MLLTVQGLSYLFPEILVFVKHDVIFIRAIVNKKTVVKVVSTSVESEPQHP